MQTLVDLEIFNNRKQVPDSDAENSQTLLNTDPEEVFYFWGVSIP